MPSLSPPCPLARPRQTAEVVQIDLGVAFDTGRSLRVPELVPFRLTRDLVDAMGRDGRAWRGAR